MKKVCIITADYNDADYVTQETVIKTSEDLQLVQDIAAAIKGFNRHNVKRLLSQEAIKKYHPDYVWEFLPSGPDDNQIHTIKSIRIIEISKEDVLYSY